MELSKAELQMMRDALNLKIEALIERKYYTDAHTSAVLRDRVQEELDKLAD